MEEQKRFVADASHELKTPLTALHTSIEVALRDKKMTLEEAARVLRESLTDIRSLTQLSNDLLSLARYQQGQNNFKKELVNIKDVVSEARRLIAPFARKLRIALSADVQSVTITANKESLIKLLTILFDNAVKYSRPGGSVTVTTIRGRKQLAIVIQDTGVGISAPDLPHIFDRFYRVDQSRTKHKVTGFGLGLSMVKKIAALHGGSIDASSIVGKGSIFTVKLPL
jgi:signal transduction histidine kinase